MTKYNIFNFLTIKLDSKNKKYIRYFNNEYQKMTDKTTPTDAKTRIKITVGKLPTEKKGDIVKEKKFKKLFTYRYLVRGIDTDNVEIYFAEHFIDKIYINAIGVFLQANVLEPIMYYKLLQKEVVFMHAAGVASNNNGYLMPAYGGTGKTTLSLRLVSRGFRLLGDDLLLVDMKKKVVYAYPRPFHIFTYNIKSLEGASVPLKYKIIIYTKNVLRWFLEKITREEFLISTRIHADELYSGDIWSEVVEYKKILFLKKTGEHEKHQLSTEGEITKNAKNIINSADLNDSLKENIITQPKQTKDFQALELKQVKNLLRTLKEITYINTRKVTDEELEKFFDAQ